MNPLDIECWALLRMIEKFSTLTLERGKRPDALGQQIQDGYVRLLQIPAREFTPHVWDLTTERYREVF